ncbi:hypothetical protein ACFYN0_04965 [Streptomyces sp. NPDC006704]|uniref:hypothetical protein n=1 Tax=Streptomyces sp. NPDC006704 TaxID=3364760 RepID=UPI0036B5BC54
MAFGRKSRPEEPFEPVHWNDITKFTVGRMTRHTFRASKRGAGPHAVRFHRSRGGEDHMVPGVYIVPAAPPATLSKGGFLLFEDEGNRQLLCGVLPDGSDRYRVTDAGGQELGSVRRTSITKKLTYQGLWLEQVGQPAVVARHNWARGGLLASAERGAGHVLGGVVDSLLSFGAEGGDRATDFKPVVWAVETDGPKGERGEAVLTVPRTTGSVTWYFVMREGWLDKRLAFALAVLRESETFGADRR